MTVTRRFMIAGSAALMSSRAGWSQQPEPIIGHDDPFEPFAYVESGQSKGMLVELVAAVLSRTAFARFAWRPLPLATIEAELAADRIQALAFKGVTPQRRQAMDFSAPLVITGAALFVKAGTPPAGDLAAYRGRTVVTPAQGPLAAQIAAQFPDIRLLTVESYVASLDAVLAGQADVAALNFQVGQRLANQRYAGRFTLPERPYAELPLAFAVAKGRNAPLLAAFDAGLAAAIADGTHARIVRNWTGG